MIKTMLILYVADQKKSCDFYKAILGKEPQLDVPGMTEFELNDLTILGLMPEEGIQCILGGAMPHPAKGNGIPRCELYLNVENPEFSYKKRIKPKS
jgi:catechol 2,3-dioxygenase-like lactoylglutathione lyase family enzyme